MRYILVTPAKNEEAFIEKTLNSMIAQTVPPELWVIVDDGSTDRTAEIVRRYTAGHGWIKLVSRKQDLNRDFASKARAVETGLEHVRSFEFEVMGNLDADTSFEPDYMEFLLKKFADDPQLGVAGTPFTQDGGYDSTKDSFEGENYVAGPCQLFRWECWKDIGGYVANPAGGVDWIAVMTARFKGWRVRAFADKRYHHHRSMGTANRSETAALFSYGEKDYYLGNSPIWQMFRVAYRLAKKPLVIGAMALGSGYVWAAIRRVRRPVSNEIVRFHRGEQMKKLKQIARNLLHLKKVESFHLQSGAASNEK